MDAPLVTEDVLDNLFDQCWPDPFPAPLNPGEREANALERAKRDACRAHASLLAAEQKGEPLGLGARFLAAFRKTPDAASQTLGRDIVTLVETTRETTEKLVANPEWVRAQIGVTGAEQPAIVLKARAYLATPNAQLADVIVQSSDGGGYEACMAYPHNRRLCGSLLSHKTLDGFMEHWAIAGERRIAMARDVIAAPNVPTMRAATVDGEARVAFQLGDKSVPLRSRYASHQDAQQDLQRGELDFLHAATTLRGEIDGTDPDAFRRRSQRRYVVSGKAISADEFEKSLGCRVDGDKQTLRRAEESGTFSLVRGGLTQMARALNINPTSLGLHGTMRFSPASAETVAADCSPGSGAVGLASDAAYTRSDGKPRVVVAPSVEHRGALAGAWYRAFVDDRDGSARMLAGTQLRYSGDLPFARAQESLEGAMATLPGYQERSKAYAALTGDDSWADPQEMAVRAFESHVAMRMNKMGVRNRAVTDVPEEGANGMPRAVRDVLHPYPNAAESLKLAAHFERMLDVATKHGILEQAGPHAHAMDMASAAISGRLVAGQSVAAAVPADPAWKRALGRPTARPEPERNAPARERETQEESLWSYGDSGPS